MLRGSRNDRGGTARFVALVLLLPHFSVAFTVPWGRSFSQMNHFATQVNPEVTADGQLEMCAENELSVVQQLTEQAIFERGNAKGLEALDRLSEMCSRRLSYNFESQEKLVEGSVVSHVPQLLPRSVTEEISERIKDMVRKGWLMTNPDSVDGLPSFHLNLVSSGKPLVGLDMDDTQDGFEKEVCRLSKLVEPFIYDELLPKVNDLLNTTSIRVDDVFLRRYGQEAIDGKSRNSISAHYDVLSKVTSVIALDDVATEGRNGLYTTALSPDSGATSNHASLRRFFPLTCGDGVIHTWDLLHGVDVEPGLDRTSLIIWFTVDDEVSSNGDASRLPWLTGRSDLPTNDVAQFVLGSAIENSYTSTTKSSSSPTEAIQRSVSSSSSKDHHSHDLFLDSASRGNSFAMTRLGSLYVSDELTPERIKRANQILDRLVPTSSLPRHVKEDEQAKRFWLAASVRGNPLAQIALADEIMVEASESKVADARLLAAVLFGLAAQQGNEQALDALVRVVEFEASSCGFQSQDDFEQSPIVQVAQTACSRL